MDGQSMAFGRRCSLMLHAYTSHTQSVCLTLLMGASYMFIACMILPRPGYVYWMLVLWRLGWCPEQLLWHLVQTAVECWCRSSGLFREEVLCVSGPKGDRRILTLLVTSTLWVLGWQACTIVPGFMQYSDQTQGLHACWTGELHLCLILLVGPSVEWLLSVFLAWSCGLRSAVSP